MTFPKTAAVIGGGTMGAGIAQVLAVAGAHVTVVESGDDAAEAARQRIRKSVDQGVERGKISESAAEVMSRLDTVTDLDALPGSLDLVVEAVPEIPKLKVSLLGAAERAVGRDTVIATNTSSLPIAELGAALQEPSRFLGMHFFNPVPASKLVEVVRGPSTDDAVIDRVRSWVQVLGKTEIVVNDSPGFATSRLGVMLGLEAIRMLEEGVADAADIDRAMELGYRHPMGPLRSTDLVGLDVRLAIAEYLQSTLGDRFAPPQLLRDKVARGETGRKSGQGFYTWS